MSGSSDTNLGTVPVREGYEFDFAALGLWMAANVSDFAGPLSVEQFRGGRSNPNYKLITPDRAYVLRRKPPGETLKGTHAVDREAKVLNGLAKANFPVAHVHGLCTDESVIGTWFYVMDLLEGRIFWDATLPGIANGERAAIFDAMNETIARLHRIDYQAVGLQLLHGVQLLSPFCHLSRHQGPRDPRHRRLGTGARESGGAAGADGAGMAAGRAGMKVDLSNPSCDGI